MEMEKLWADELTSARKSLLAVIIYAVFYHRNPLPGGKVKALNGMPLVEPNTTELIALIRIADGLDFGLANGSPNKVEKVEMARTSKGVECRVFPRLGMDGRDVVAKSYNKREVFEAIFGKLTLWLPGEHGSWVPCQLVK